MDKKMAGTPQRRKPITVGPCNNKNTRIIIIALVI